MGVAVVPVRNHGVGKQGDIEVSDSCAECLSGSQALIKILIAGHHAVSGEVLPARGGKRHCPDSNGSHDRAGAFPQRLRQAFRIIVAKENCGAVPKFAE